MKKTKVVIKKKKERQPRQKQKQKQNVSVNVNIDQSKRTTQRKPKGDKMTNQSTTMASGENYVKSNPFSYLPPVVYQPPFNQVYGQLQPVGNTSDSMSRMITNEQTYNSVVPRSNVPNDSLYNTPQTFNIMNLAIQQRKEITDKLNTDFQSAMDFAKTFNQPTEPKVEIVDDDNENNDDVPALVANDIESKAIEQQDEIQELQPSPPPPIETQSQSQSQSQIIDERLAVVKNKTTYLNSLTADIIRNYAEGYGIITQIDNKSNTIGGKKVSKAILIPKIIAIWEEKNN